MLPQSHLARYNCPAPNSSDHLFFDQALALCAFTANLIAYRAGGFASGLAGCLAFAATTGCDGFCQIFFIDGLDVFCRHMPNPTLSLFLSICLIRWLTRPNTPASMAAR